MGNVIAIIGANHEVQTANSEFALHAKATPKTSGEKRMEALLARKAKLEKELALIEHPEIAHKDMVAPLADFFANYNPETDVEKAVELIRETAKELGIRSEHREKSEIEAEKAAKEIRVKGRNALGFPARGKLIEVNEKALTDWIEANS